MTTTSPTKSLTMPDTTVLVDALYQDLPEYPAALHLLTLAEDAAATFCVAPQVLAEFYQDLCKVHAFRHGDIRRACRRLDA